MPAILKYYALGNANADGTGMVVLGDIINKTGAVTSADFNTMLTYGNYIMNAGQTHAPEAVYKYYLEVISDSNDATYCQQKATQLNNTAPIVYMRTMVASAWGSWVQTYPAVFSA